MANPNNLNGNNTGQQVGAQFGIPTSGQITPNGIDPATGHASAASAGDSMAGTFVDPNGIVGGLYNDILGFTSQSREQSWQEHMTDKENRWNSAQEQMKRAKEAGINPLTAAGGIAGNGTGSVASAAGGATPSSAPADAVSALGGLPSEIAGKKAGAEAAMATARNADKLASASILKDAASAASSLVGCGIPEIAAMELGLKLAQNGLDGFSAAFNADNYCRLYDMEFDKLEAEINTENIRWAEIEARKNLYVSETEWNRVKTQHEEILKGFDSRRFDLSKKYEAFMADNGMLQEFLLFKQFGANSPEYQGYMKYLKDRFYYQGSGSYEAQVEKAFDLFKNQVQGSDAGKRVNAEYFAKLENYKYLFGELAHMLFSSDGSLEGLGHRIVSLMSASIGLGEAELEKFIKDAFKPSDD